MNLIAILEQEVHADYWTFSVELPTETRIFTTQIRILHDFVDMTGHKKIGPCL